MTFSNARSVFLSSISLLLCALCANIAQAANTTVNHVAARAQSMQAFTGVADDASAVHYNPAGLTQVKGFQIENGAAILLSFQEFTNSNNGVRSTSYHGIPAPYFFLSSPLNDKVTFGFGFYAPFARKSTFHGNGAVNNQIHKSKFIRLDAAPTLAVKVTDYLSIGGGPVISHVRITTDILGVAEKVRGFGLSAQGGLMLFLPHKVNLGLMVKSPMTADMQGFGYLGPYLGPVRGEFTTHLRFPAILNVGASWQVKPWLMLAAEWDHEFWSRLQRVVKEYDNPLFNQASVVTLNAHDANNFRVGVRVKPNENNEIHAGYSYLDIAIPPANILPAIPDFISHYISVGVSHYRGNWRFDLGYELGLADDRVSTNPIYPGLHKAHLDTILLGVAYKMGPPPAKG